MKIWQILVALSFTWIHVKCMNISVSEGSEDCPKDDDPWIKWEKFETLESHDKKKSFCYAHVDGEKMTWNEAEKYCRRLSKKYGQKFTTFLASPAKKELLISFAEKFAKCDSVKCPWPWHPGKTPPHKEDDKRGPFIGGSDQRKEKEWRWRSEEGIDVKGPVIDRAQLVNGNDFADNGAGTQRNEDCMEIWNDKGAVNDIQCDFWEMSFICEAVPN